MSSPKNVRLGSLRVRTIAFFVVSICWASSAAQAQYSSSWVGVRAGATFGSESMTLPDGSSTSLKFGPLGGIEYEHFFNENSGLSLSLLFNGKGINENYGASSGGRKDTSGNYYSGDDNFSFGYLEIPIVFKQSFGYGDIKPYVFAGPSVGLLLSASETVGTPPTGLSAIPPVADLKSDLSPIDISIYFGGGVMDRIYHGPTLFFDAGYAVGVTKVYKSTPANRVATQVAPFSSPIDPTEAKSADIRVTVGVLWKI